MEILPSVITGQPVGRGEIRLEPNPAPLPAESWNDTARAFPENSCVPQLVAERAAAAPEAVALVVGEKVLTYGQLESRANRLAHHLRSLGVGPDAIVGVCLSRSPEFVVAALGVLKAGGVYLPLDPDSPTDRLAFMLRDAQGLLLVTRQPKAAQLRTGRWRTVALDVDEAQIAGQPSTAPPYEATTRHLAYVIYTSGSTGQPKGVKVAHRSLLNLLYWHQRTFAVTAADRATHLANPGFDAAVWELWPHLTAGASVYLPDDATRNRPEALRDWLVSQRITISFVPATLAERLIFLEWPSETSLRLLLTGADTLHSYPPPGLPFALVNNYGPTECAVVATSGRVPAGQHSEVLPSIGRPIDNVRIYLLDECLKQVPVGTSGEVYIGGLGVARGYVSRPELTAERFILDPFSEVPGAHLYKTGDLARYLPDGQIAFLGRVDDQIKIDGYRIEPDEIVNALNGHPCVQASVVAAREDRPGEKYLVAYVLAAGDGEISSGALRDFLKLSLPSYMIPVVFVQLESLPLTSNGKVDRAALPAPNPSNTVRDKAFVAPRSIVEERVAGILASLLGLEQVGANDNFFLLGGHSLLGTQVIARVRGAFDVELPLRVLFDHPTVAAMSAEIERLVLTKLEGMSDEEIQRALDSNANQVEAE